MTDLEVGRIAAATGTEFVSWQDSVVLFRRDERLFSLVPGGVVTVGYAGADFRPTREQAESYQEAAREYGLPSIQRHVDVMTSPRRTVRVPNLLVAVEALNASEEYETDYETEVESLAEEGMRLPTPDEWEWACGGGATTLFRWGDDCPMDRDPVDPGHGPHRELNRFGLRIGQDPYDCERTSDPGVVCGGDGGGMVCGGVGYFLGWLTLATAFQDRHFAEEVLPDPDNEVDLYLRPVIELKV